MAIEMAFWAEPEHMDAIRAANGFASRLKNVPLCPFNVGDTFSYPGPTHALAYRVTQRHYQPMADGSAKWVMKIEPCAHPVAG